MITDEKQRPKGYEQKRQRDAFCNVVPDRLKPIFAMRWRIARFAHQFEALYTNLALIEDEPYAHFIDIAGIRKTVKEIENHIRRGEPMIPCDCHLRGKYGQCNVCDNTGWIPASRYEDKFGHSYWDRYYRRRANIAPAERKGFLGGDVAASLRQLFNTSPGATGTVAGDGKEGVDHPSDGLSFRGKLEDGDGDSLAGPDNGRRGEDPVEAEQT